MRIETNEPCYYNGCEEVGNELHEFDTGTSFRTCAQHSDGISLLEIAGQDAERRLDHIDGKSRRWIREYDFRRAM